jgi:hypothetical protein
MANLPVNAIANTQTMATGANLPVELKLVDMAAATGLQYIATAGYLLTNMTTQVRSILRHDSGIQPGDLVPEELMFLMEPLLFGTIVLFRPLIL